MGGDEFSHAVRATNSQRAVALGMGVAHRPAIASGRAGFTRITAASRGGAAQRSKNAAGPGGQGGQAGGAALGADAAGAKRLPRTIGRREPPAATSRGTGDGKNSERAARGVRVWGASRRD